MTKSKEFEVGEHVEFKLHIGDTNTYKGIILKYQGRMQHSGLGKGSYVAETYLVSFGYDKKYVPVDCIYKLNPKKQQKEEQVSEQKIKSDGGPSLYYDFPSDWNTFNDFLEYKSVHQWKGFSFHLGNIGKAICRWGDKEGTTEVYDAKKIIYSATRVLKMIVGVQETRKYLQSLLDDEQFKQ